MQLYIHFLFLTMKTEKSPTWQTQAGHKQARSAVSPSDDHCLDTDNVTAAPLKALQIERVRATISPGRAGWETGSSHNRAVKDRLSVTVGLCLRKDQIDSPSGVHR